MSRNLHSLNVYVERDDSDEDDEKTSTSNIDNNANVPLEITEELLVNEDDNQPLGMNGDSIPLHGSNSKCNSSSNHAGRGDDNKRKLDAKPSKSVCFTVENKNEDEDGGSGDDRNPISAGYSAAKKRGREFVVNDSFGGDRKNGEACERSNDEDADRLTLYPSIITEETYLRKNGVHRQAPIRMDLQVLALDLEKQNVANVRQTAAHTMPLTRYEQLQGTIGYNFNNVHLLHQALTHPSIVGEANNRNLEFLGDSVLNFAVAVLIYKNAMLADEGSLTRVRSSLVSNNKYALIGKLLRLHELLRVSVNQVIETKMIADAFEALAGAVYIDSGYKTEVLFSVFEMFLFSIPKSGGITAPAVAAPDCELIPSTCQNYCSLLQKEGIVDPIDLNYKGKLQELVQKELQSTPEYKVEDLTISSAHPKFSATVFVKGAQLGTATNKDKKSAERDAAMAALEILKKGGLGKYRDERPSPRDAGDSTPRSNGDASIAPGEVNYKGLFQELMQKERSVVPTYKTIDITKTLTNPQFQSTVFVGNVQVGTAIARDKKSAEKGAAKEAYNKKMIEIAMRNRSSNGDSNDFNNKVTSNNNTNSIDGSGGVLDESLMLAIIRPPVEVNHKGQLQEYAQKHSKPMPRYITKRTKSKSGGEKTIKFESRVMVGNEQYGSAVAADKKAAEKEAARIALIALGVANPQTAEAERSQQKNRSDALHKVTSGNSIWEKASPSSGPFGGISVSPRYLPITDGEEHTAEEDFDEDDDDIDKEDDEAQTETLALPPMPSF